jgi:hypothetical protein
MRQERGGTFTDRLALTESKLTALAAPSESTLEASTGHQPSAATGGGASPHPFMDVGPYSYGRSSDCGHAGTDDRPGGAAALVERLHAEDDDVEAPFIAWDTRSNGESLGGEGAGAPAEHPLRGLCSVEWRAVSPPDNDGSGRPLLEVIAVQVDACSQEPPSIEGVLDVLEETHGISLGLTMPRLSRRMIVRRTTTVAAGGGTIAACLAET